MLRFHVRIYARPAATTEGAPRTVSGMHVAPLLANQAELLSGWPITFDAAAAAIQQLPRLHFEPDGSFVRVSSGERQERLCGVLYDRGPRLAYVEVQGACRADWLEEFLRSLGWPATPLAFELIPEALLLSEADFRVVAGRQSVVQ